MIVLLLAACARGPADPRPTMQAGWTEGRPARLEPAAALRDERYFEACVGFKQAARGTLEESPWRGLLLVGARDPSCLPVEQGAALAGWAHGREGWADAVGEWEAGHDLFVDAARLSPSSRLRVLLRGTDQAAVVEAAEAVLRGDATDPFACAVVVRDAVDRGELEEAVSVCEAVTASSVVRLRAAALDEAGRLDDAVTAYDRAGLALHAAAVLYQERPERDAEALARLDEAVPPAAIHRGWRSILRREPVETALLDGSPEATMLRALAGSGSAVAALRELPGLEALVLHARLSGELGALDAELARDPTSDVLLRAALGVRLERGQNLDALRVTLLATDPDHVRLGGVVTRREAPWRAIVPWSWAELTERGHLAPLAGRDPVGDAWRAAAELPAPERADALARLQAEHPSLRGLARHRAGGSFLDGPPGSR